MLTLDKIYHAAFVLKDVARKTDLIEAPKLSKDCQLYLKTENLQVTGSFKVRGAYYKISTLSDEERKKGLITASAGNHAQGVAYAAKCYGVKAVIVMPTTTPLIKVNRTKGYGAEVILHGDVYDEACEYALKLAEEKGYTFVHPFDDPAVATGQGTIAMEIFKELPLVEYILYLANGHSLKALCGKTIQYGVLYRRYGVIPAVLRAGILTVSAYERTCDDAAHKVVANQYLPCLLAHGVQLIERYYILMGGYLKYAVRGGVYYRLAGRYMFIAQLLNYNGA